MECYFPGWGVSLRDGMLVNEKGCYFPGRGGSILDGMLVYGMGC